MQKAAALLDKATGIILFLIFVSVLAAFPIVQQRQFLFIGLQIFLSGLGFSRQGSRSLRLGRAQAAVVTGYLLVIYLWNLLIQIKRADLPEWLVAGPFIFWIVLVCFIAWTAKILLSGRTRLFQVFFSSFGIAVLLAGLLFAGIAVASPVLARRGLVDGYLGREYLWPYFAMVMGYFMIVEKMDNIRTTRIYLGNLISCLGAMVIIKLIFELISSP